ncbi:hypothetical protein [Hymenobacter mucosus]|uniref:Uncharacterized protein n=1 Tax=Hymenobacter mucosus TaxID=1411120 RepID=A0A239AAJ0_9BACT|nr:hypothetical protein [Hymenobacter mucosus]SNR92549.1 hypothetical protein SAMN06269173_111106 [Hymenobacter mucosus]
MFTPTPEGKSSISTSKTIFLSLVGFFVLGIFFMQCAWLAANPDALKKAVDVILGANTPL